MFVTSTSPSRSTIGPRCAWRRKLRIWLFCASDRYWSPEITCRAQSRKKSAQKTMMASTPKIPRRTAIWGEKRYGSSTRGSGGRKPGPRDGSLAGLDSGAHLAADAHTGRQQAGAEAVQRVGEEHVEREAREQHGEEELRRGDGLPEHEVEHRR